MKYHIIVCCLSFSAISIGQDWYKKWDQAGGTWMEKWTNTLDSIESLPNDEKMKALGAAVRAKSSLGGRVPNPDQIEIGNRASEALLSIPGHAQYFMDELENQRKDRNNWDTRLRYYVISQTLVHLPSPETIKVLGNLLYDERDAMPVNLPVEKQYQYPANSVLSAVAVNQIGLRSPPMTRRVNIDEDPIETLAATRSWWEEVKSGQRAFSFVGQKVEYRFQPDGTWDTLAMSKAPDDETRPLKRPPPTRETSKNMYSSPRWSGMLAVVLVLISAVIWLLWRQQQRSA